ncbi:unnamed protein product [Blepharisma stoltei]|uniref:Uncharacterized protein n=1 Tax=Blepharisma stoltei TaxID=1481888 RepID=A0AAU9IAB7_9CILI|nr:unnamed protein product [Blepharisma stoltei]
MPRFTWTQLMTWERDALRQRVPLEIQGLIPREVLPNNRYLILSGVTFERNGQKVIFNNIAMMRIGFFSFFFLAGYQVLREQKWGWEMEQENHNLEFDNTVYPKLSCNMVPYHESVVAFP